jgi:uracil-DNA glycosylase
VFGKITPINKNRGRLMDLNSGIKALVTVHPSYLLRLPDEATKAREYDLFVGDLRIAAALLRKSAPAARLQFRSSWHDGLGVSACPIARLPGAN